MAELFPLTDDDSFNAALAAWVALELQLPSPPATIVTIPELYKLVKALSNAPVPDYPQGSLKVHRAEAIDRLKRHLEHTQQLDVAFVATEDLLNERNTSAHNDFLWQLFEIFVLDDLPGIQSSDDPLVEAICWLNAQVYTLDPTLPFVTHYSSVELDVSLFNLMLVLAQQLEVQELGHIPPDTATAEAYLQWVLDVAQEILDMNLPVAPAALLADSRAMALFLTLIWRAFGRQIQALPIPELPVDVLRNVIDNSLHLEALQDEYVDLAHQTQTWVEDALDWFANLPWPETEAQLRQLMTRDLHMYFSVDKPRQLTLFNRAQTVLFEVQTFRRTHRQPVYTPPGPLLLTQLKSQWDQLVAVEASHQTELRHRATRIQQAHNVLSSFARKADLQQEWTATCLVLVQQTPVGESVPQCQRALQRQQALEADCASRQARLDQLTDAVTRLRAEELPGTEMAEERLEQLNTQWDGLLKAVQQRRATLTALLLVETVLAASEECHDTMATVSDKLQRWHTAVEDSQNQDNQVPVMLADLSRTSHEASQADLEVVRLAPLASALGECQTIVQQLEKQVAAGLVELPTLAGKDADNVNADHPMASALQAELADRQTQLSKLEQQYAACTQLQESLTGLDDIETRVHQAHTALTDTRRLVREQAQVWQQPTSPTHNATGTLKRISVLLKQQQVALRSMASDLRTHTSPAVAGWHTRLGDTVGDLTDNATQQQQTVDVLQAYITQRHAFNDRQDQVTQVAMHVAGAQVEVLALKDASPVRVESLSQHIVALGNQLQKLAPGCVATVETGWQGVDSLPAHVLTNEDWQHLQTAQNEHHHEVQQQLEDTQAKISSLQTSLSDYQVRQAQQAQQEALARELQALQALVARREAKLVAQGATISPHASPHGHNPTSAIVSSIRRGAERQMTGTVASPPKFVSQPKRLQELTQVSPPATRPESPHAGLRDRIMNETAILEHQPDDGPSDLGVQKEKLLGRVAGLDALEAELLASQRWHAQLQAVVNAVQVHETALANTGDQIHTLAPNVATAQLNARLTQLATHQNQIQVLQSSGEDVVMTHPGQEPKMQAALAAVRALLTRTQDEANKQALRLAQLAQLQPHVDTLTRSEQQLLALTDVLHSIIIPPTTLATTAPEDYSLLGQSLSRQRATLNEQMALAKVAVVAVQEISTDQDVIQARVATGEAAWGRINAMQPATEAKLDGLSALVALAARQQGLHVRLSGIQTTLAEQQAQLDDSSLPATVDGAIKQQQNMQLLARAINLLQQDLGVLSEDQDTLDKRVQAGQTQLDTSASSVLVKPEVQRAVDTLARLQTECEARQTKLHQHLVALRLQDEVAHARDTMKHRQDALIELQEQPFNTRAEQQRQIRALAQLQLDVNLQAESDARLQSELDDVMASVNSTDVERRSPEGETLSQALTSLVSSRQALQQELTDHQDFIAAAVLQQQRQQRWQAVESELLVLEELMNKNTLDAGLTPEVLKNKKRELYRCELQLEGLHSRMLELQGGDDGATGNADGRTVALPDGDRVARLTSLAATLAETLAQEKRALGQWRGYLLWQEQVHALLVWCEQSHRTGQKLLSTRLQEYQPLRKQRQFDLWCFEVHAKTAVAASLQEDAQALTADEHLMLHLSDLFDLKGRLDSAWQAILDLKGSLMELFDALAGMQEAILGLDEIQLGLDGILTAVDDTSVGLRQDAVTQRMVKEQTRVLEQLHTLSQRLDDLDLEVDESAVGPARELAQVLQQTETRLAQAVAATDARLARLHGVLRYNSFQEELGEMAAWLGQQQRAVRSLMQQLGQAKDEEADDVVLSKAMEIERAMKVHAGTITQLKEAADELHAGMDKGASSLSRGTRTAVAQEQHVALATRFVNVQASIDEVIATAEANKGVHALLWDMEALQSNIRAKGHLLDLKAGRDVLTAQVKLVAADLPGYQEAATRLEKDGQVMAKEQPTHRHALTVRAGMLQPAVQGLQAKLTTSKVLLTELAELKHVEDQRSELDARVDVMHRELQRHTDAMHACSQELEKPRATALYDRACEAVHQARGEMFELTKARQQVHIAGVRLSQSASALPRAMVQQLLTALESKQRWKSINDTLTQTDRDVQRMGRLITTAREIDRMERWMRKQSNSIHHGAIEDEETLEAMLRDMASLDKLVRLQDNNLRELKSKSV
eukprot:m.256378 g.256378  ORF g.256378 m.256378 type:complete len:2174 (-) comp17565_c0_seq1:65-6586(-)